MNNKTKSRIYDFIFILILLSAILLRITGTDWDGDMPPHPDERFLTEVTTAVSPVDSLTEYFDTANSTLNPNNRGYSFFVYGTFPIFMTRYVAEWVDMTGYGQITIVGRYLSALMDTLVVFMVYLIARRLFNERVALMAGIFSAFTVLEIQLSHFYVVDPFTNCFVIFTIYIAVFNCNAKIKRVQSTRSKQLTKEIGG